MYSLWALPGFLGLRSDWKFLHMDQLIGIDLSMFPLTGLDNWSKSFNSHALSSKTKPAFLMGYSLGGRLALHSLLNAPQSWDAAIIISAHSGLKTESERNKRRLRDQKWADRFLAEDWQKLMHAWNSQKLFKGSSFSFARLEKNFQRFFLAEALSHASLGSQEDLKDQIGHLPMPILWITGEYDQKFSEIAHNLNFSNPLSRHAILSNSGHRAPWEQPELFEQALQDFIAQLSFL